MRRDFLSVRLSAWAGLLFIVLTLYGACVTRQHHPQSTANDRRTLASAQTNSANPQAVNPNRININTGSAAELEKLPGIGRALAERIVEHREKYGAFRRPEHLIMVRGISDRRYRALRDLI